jgi:hypothetical protein
MIARKTSATPRRKTKRLKVRKETIKNLDVRVRGNAIKGGGCITSRPSLPSPICIDPT